MTAGWMIHNYVERSSDSILIAMLVAAAVTDASSPHSSCSNLAARLTSNFAAGSKA
jgi:hypothetical protein